MATVVAYCVILLGVIHVILTPVFYKKLSVNAMWFAGTGLALVMLGFVNLLAYHVSGGDALVRIVQGISNLAGLLYMAVLTAIYPRLQVVIGLVLVLLLTVLPFIP